MSNISKEARDTILEIRDQLTLMLLSMSSIEVVWKMEELHNKEVFKKGADVVRDSLSKVAPEIENRGGRCESHTTYIAYNKEREIVFKGSEKDFVNFVRATVEENEDLDIIFDAEEAIKYFKGKYYEDSVEIDFTLSKYHPEIKN